MFTPAPKENLKCKLTGLRGFLSLIFKHLKLDYIIGLQYYNIVSHIFFYSIFFNAPVPMRLQLKRDLLHLIVYNRKRKASALKESGKNVILC